MKKQLPALLILCMCCLCGCHITQTIYPSSSQEPEQPVVTKNALELEDGTKIDLAAYSSYQVYQLNDGTELLNVQNPHGPNDVYVGGLESFDDLNAPARSNVLAFYTEQGILYDIHNELERAYADYQNTLDKSEFCAYFLSQDISPSASNEDVMYFLTTVMLPISSNNHYELRLGTAFQKETGKHISNLELFNCSEEGVKQTLLDLADISNPTLRSEMEAAFNPEYIVFFQDNLEISFPPGTLPSQEYSYILGLKYDQALCEILHEWAVPKHTE